MQVKTKYSIGDEVWGVHCVTNEHWVNCSECDGEGTLELKTGRLITCDGCSGRKGSQQQTCRLWRPRPRGTITKVSLTHTAQLKGLETITTTKEEYLVEIPRTNISFYNNPDMLFATEQEALDKCAELNNPPREEE